MDGAILFKDLPGIDPDFDSTVQGQIRHSHAYHPYGNVGPTKAGASCEITMESRRIHCQPSAGYSMPISMEDNGARPYGSYQYQHGYAESPWCPLMPEPSLQTEEYCTWTANAQATGYPSPTPSFTDASASDDGSHGPSSHWGADSLVTARFHNIDQQLSAAQIPHVTPTVPQQVHQDTTNCANFGFTGPILYSNSCKMEDVYPDGHLDDATEQEADGTRVGPLDMRIGPCSEPEDHALTPASCSSQAIDIIKDESAVEDEDDGSDYSPSSPRKLKGSRTTRTRKYPLTVSRGVGKAARRSSGRATRRPLKSGTSHASDSKPPSNRITCPHCSQSVHSKASLNKHITTTHTRPFTCTFQKYGCTSTFGSKNEWKRHVASQHLRLGFWRCQLGRCYPQASLDGNDEEEELIFNDFNRKDLFTQHLRRMHAPHPSSLAADKAAFNSSLESVTQRCFVAVRSTPPQSLCGYCTGEGKEQTFEGPGAWEARMEHVGRHLESGHGEAKAWVEDQDLKRWLIAEGLIEGNDSSGWRLVGLQSDERGRRR